MKQFIAKYTLYVYLHFIKDNDVDIYKNWAKPVIKITNIFRSVYVWIASIIFFPIFFIGMKFEERKYSILKKFFKLITNI